MWIIWMSLLGIAAVVGCDLAFRRYVTPRICDIFENVPPFNVVTENPVDTAENISIVTADGVNLKGSLINGHLRDAKGLVLFLPELRGNHWMAKRYCTALIDQGYMVLSVDFRSQGESAFQPGYSPIHWVTEFEMMDVDAMMHFIQTRPTLKALPLLVYGVSRGGVAALISACRYSEVSGVVADSAFGTMSMTKYFVDRFVTYVIPQWVYRLLPTWHVDLTLRDGIKRSERRRKCQYVHLERERASLDSRSVLLISGGRDSYVTPEIARRLQSIVGQDCQLWIAPGAKHNMSRKICTEEYDRKVVAHCDQCLVAKSNFAAETLDQRTVVAHAA